MTCAGVRCLGLWSPVVFVSEIKLALLLLDIPGHRASDPRITKHAPFAE